MLTDSQVLEGMISAMAERGIALPPEQIASDRAALAARLNGEEPPAMTAPIPQPQPQKPTLTADPGAGIQPMVQESPDMTAIDAAAFAGPESPAAYRFDAPPGVEHDLKQEMAMREMFYQHGVPVSLAAEVSRQWLKGVMNPPTPQQRDRAYADGHVQLTRIYRDQVPNVLKVANAELDRMVATHPQIKDMLRVSGLNNSWWLVSNLHSLARAKGRA
jgi:hypothetical protein